MKRSKFIQNLTAGVVLPNIVKGFSMNAFAASPLLQQQLAATVSSEKVLVLVRLEGGNDGLNMVIPLDKYSELFAKRSNIIIPENQALALTGNSTVGLHPSMTGMRSLYNEGKIKVIQGLGYPGLTQSHFRSTDVWMSASDANTYVGSGFAGRYLDYKYTGYPNGYPNVDMPDPLGIEIASGKSLMFEGTAFGNSIPITSTTAFYNLINGIQTAVLPNTGGEQLSYIRTIQRQSNAYSNVIVNAAANVTTQLAYPQNDFAQSLKIVASLIGGGLKTKIYMVSLGSFDTHDGQLSRHANLLQDLSDGIKVFMDDIAQLGAANNVLGMTYSEFGRRISSNASSGTDHGSAAPQFMFGHKVAGGVLGTTPDIASDVANNDENVSMQFDFRSVYTTILKDWFCVPTGDLPTIMLSSFNTLPIIRPDATCNAVLPVNLLLFTASLRRRSDAFVQWKANEDSGFNHYELEHSADLLSFHFAARLNKKSGSVAAKDYDFTHTQTVIGKNFYRLKMVDNDGSYKYSEIVQVTVENQLVGISIVPNPVKNIFQIKTSAVITELQLFSINGSLLRKVIVAANSPVDISDFRPGNYVVKCFNKNTLVAVSKLLKE